MCVEQNSKLCRNIDRWRYFRRSIRQLTTENDDSPFMTNEKNVYNLWTVNDSRDSYNGHCCSYAAELEIQTIGFNFKRSDFISNNE